MDIHGYSWIFFSVQLSKKAEKDLKKVPLHISEKLQIWIDLIENEGLRASRKIKSFHDEPLRENGMASVLFA